MKSLLLSIIICLLAFTDTFAQAEKGKKNSFYAYWGYNRSVFSNSDLHFNGPDFDVTFYDVQATDRPSAFGWIYVNPTKITIPQYNARIGYFISDNLAISLGVDHMKYVVTDFQEVKFSGVINEAISPQYAGTYLNETITIEPDLLQFEHSDGLNFISLEFDWYMKLKQFKRFSLGLNTGMGGVWMLTKTNVKILGKGVDNDFHFAGYSFAGKIGPRIEYNENFFLLAEVKGGYASLPNVLVENEAPERGDHNVFYSEFYITVGKYFRKRGKGD